MASFDFTTPAPEPDQHLDEVTKWLKLISIPTLLILGTAGNGLVILVLSVRKLKPHPTSLMLVFLALFDTSVLWTGHFRMLYLQVYRADFRSQSDAMCKIHTQMTYFSVSVSVWTLVLVTSHRLIAVYFPLQAKTLLTMRRTVIGLVLMILICFLFNLHFYWTIGLVADPPVEETTNTSTTISGTETDDPSTGSTATPANSTDTIDPKLSYSCYHLAATDNFMTFIWTRMDLVTNSIVPFIVLLLCNCTIIYKVRVGSKILSKDNSSSSKANTTMTIMLVSVNVIFLFTTAPIALYNTDVFRPWVPGYTHKDNFLYTLFYIIQGIHSASNFYIYCLSGQKFREELKLTFTSDAKRKRQKNDSIYHSSNRTNTTNARTTNHVQNDRHKTAVNVKNGDGADAVEGVVNPACVEEIVTKL